MDDFYLTIDNIINLNSKHFSMIYDLINPYQYANTYTKIGDANTKCALRTFAQELTLKYE